MDFQTIIAIVFLVALTIFVYLKRKNIDTKQIIPYLLYFSMYKARWGLKLMDSAAKKFRKLVKYIGYLGILVGFLGMAAICFELVKSLIPLFTKPEVSTGVGLVLPIKAKGIFFVPFFYWIISIFVIAVVHEFSHGLVARAHSMKVKSSGFAFLGGGFRGTGLIIIFFSFLSKIFSNNLPFSISGFFDYWSADFWLVIGIVLVLISYIKFISSIAYIPIIPAAFVEPDEKELKKRPFKEQLSVFAAGPLANIVTAFLALAILSFVIAPIVSASFEPDGVKVSEFEKGNMTYPAENAGIIIGEIIKQADATPTPYRENLSEFLHSKKPGDMITLKTDKSSYEIKLAQNPKNQSSAYMGAYLEQSAKVKDGIKSSYGEFLPNAVVWLAGLFLFLFILNLGIGMFNLVPIGPLDGGRMLQLPLQRYFGEEKGNKILGYISLFFLLIIFMNLTSGFGLFKLF